MRTAWTPSKNGGIEPSVVSTDALTISAAVCRASEPLRILTEPRL
jgi:hypothetical protein